MSKQTLLEKIDRLGPEQIVKVEKFIDELSAPQQLQPLTESERKRKMKERLVELGILSEIKPPITDFTPYQNRKPIEVTGKPTSELIIEDRR